MDIAYKIIGISMITTILCLLLSKKDKELTIVLSLAGCCLLLLLALPYFDPVIRFIRQLQRMGQLDADILQILLKSVGIGLLTEISALICTDVGNSALGKTLQIASVILILYISLPLLTSLMELVGEILGEA